MIGSVVALPCSDSRGEMAVKEKGCSAEYKMRDTRSQNHSKLTISMRQLNAMETSFELLFDSPQGAVSVLLCVTIVSVIIITDRVYPLF